MNITDKESTSLSTSSQSTCRKDCVGIKMWRLLWNYVMGDYPGADDFLSPLTGSVMYFIITMGLGFVLRSINLQVTPSFCRDYVADFLATMEMCAYFFENNFIFKHFGPLWLFIAVIIECFIANRTFFGASENPVKALYQYCKNEINIKTALVRIVVQTLAGLASYRFARLVWSLDMVPDHRERYLETACASDLNVTLLFGMLVEFGATLIDTWLGMQTLVKVSVVDEVLKLANGSLMIVVGISTTGMYFNPAMATGHTFGCKGTAAWEHLVVYWAGPFIGCYLALLLDRLLHIDVSKPKSSDLKEKKEQ